MDFEWDDRKADYNVQKHGVSFQEAATVFYDPLVITFADPDHSDDEDRFIVIGTSAQGRLGNQKSLIIPVACDMLPQPEAMEYTT
jgi:uncharacterized DUF497 family protein